MKIVSIPIDQLKPWPNNPRKFTDAAISKVAASLDRYGLRQPIVIDENKFLVVGHLRLEAAKLLKWTEIECHVMDLPAQLAAEYRIADNKLHELAKWDQELLATELDSLINPEFLIELCDLDASFREKEKTSNILPKKVISNSHNISAGDIIELGHHRVICGDARDPEILKRLMGGGTARLMVTDPPYGINYDPEWREGADLGKAGRSIGKVQNDHIADWSDVFKLWDAQIIYCWHAAVKSSTVQNSLEQLGYKTISQIIWAKQHFVLSRGDYHWQHEPCWYMAKGQHDWQGERDQSTIWEISNHNNFGGSDEETFGHGTQKPLECMARPIRNNSKHGDVVLDPFLGSGTTLVAAQGLGRRCFGTELSGDYCSMIVDRFNAAIKFTEGAKPEIRINGAPLCLSV